MAVTATQAGMSTVKRDARVKLAWGARSAASASIDADRSTPRTSYPASFNAAARIPLPHPRSVTSPAWMRLERSLVTRTSAARQATSPKPAS